MVREAWPCCNRQGPAPDAVARESTRKMWTLHALPAVEADGRIDGSGETMKRMLETLALMVVVSSVMIVPLAQKSTAQNNGAQEAQTRPKPLRPVHTFSIVARDAETGELGVAVQSHWFSVGAIVPWAEA